MDLKRYRRKSSREYSLTKRLQSIALCLLLGILVIVATPEYAPAQQDEVNESIVRYFQAKEAMQGGDLDEAAKALRQAVAGFRQQEFTKGEFMAYLASADLHRMKGDYERALSELNKAKDIALRFKDIRGAAVVLSRMGRVEEDRTRFDQAAELFKKALSNASAVEEKGLTADIKSQIALLDINRGRFGQAETLLGEALAVHKGLDAAKQKATDLWGLARIRRCRNQYVPALESLEQAISLAAAEHLKSLVNRLRLEKAGILLDQGKLKAATALLDKSLEFFKDKSDHRSATIVQIELARLMLLQDKPEEADKILDEALKGLSGPDAHFEVIRIKLQRGRALTELGRLPQAEVLLTQGLEFAVDRKAAYVEMQLRIALSRVQALQGKLIAARRNAEHVLVSAKRMGSRQGEADHYAAMGLIGQQTGNYAQAVGNYQIGLDKNRALQNSREETSCATNRASSLVEIGFLDQASKDLAGFNKRNGSPETLSQTGILLLLRGRIDAASGKWADALKKYDQATAVFGKLDRPRYQADVLVARARREAVLRNLESAFALWEEAEKLFVRMGSPGGVIKCRTARVDLALDMGDFNRALGLARKGLGIAGTGRPRLRRYLSGRSWRTARTNTANPNVRLVQAFQFPPQMRFQQQSPDSSRYYYYQDAERNGRQRSAGPDDTVFSAELTALRARVSLVSGDIATAEKESQDALKSVEAIKDDRSVARLTDLLARIHVKNGRYGEAINAFRKSGISPRWRMDRAKAMDLAAKKKSAQSVKTLEKCLNDMLELEKTEGLWFVPSRTMRERIGLFEDLVGLIQKFQVESGNPENDRLAWKYAQMAKMRRVFYQMAALGVRAFPGVPSKHLEKLRILQIANINANARAAHSQLAERYNLSVDPIGGSAGKGNAKGIDATLKSVSKTRPRFVRFFLCETPKISDVKALLPKQQAYLSFLASDRRIYAFLISAGSLRTHLIPDATGKLAQQANTVKREVSKPYSYRITKTSNDLWKALFGGFEKELTALKSIVIEADGFLAAFPFEALVPGEFPQTYREQQSAPLFMDKLEVFRSTSASRFVHQRSNKVPSRPTQSALVFAKPIISTESRTRKSQSQADSLYSMWRRSLGKFRSSPINQDSGQAARIAGLFGKKGKLLEGDRATVSAFVSEDGGPYDCLHVACPVLIPNMPAGEMRQPFIVFSTGNSERSAGFFGMRDLMKADRPAQVITLPWIGSESDSGDGIIILVEALSMAGIRWIVLPLWQVDRQGMAESTEYLTQFYSTLKAGVSIEAAKKRAGEAIGAENTSGRKNRCNPARLALF